MKKQSKQTRGQAALEFLSTYGFAFLIILVMIGALSAFGVLNPQNILPDRCTTPPAVGCVDYQLDSTADQFGIVLRNNAGERMQWINVTNVSSQDFTDVADCGEGLNVNNNEEAQITCSVSAGSVFESGDKVRIGVRGIYLTRSATWGKPFEADIFVTAS